MQNFAEYLCAYCGEPNTTFVDVSGGTNQSYVEDCQVCCRPNLLFVAMDWETESISITTDYQE
ncbi:CPXCG motif-containing cysteine-rich protein [Synechococcales cyanobacterium C]|uniref:CPXCG motif-containing cysteine-rich protein n=1 Tax=Petrachloros mirabilis ULC683 TaxID=2781853 RepID=A0A8K2A0Y7_9CYAN|nr:CPXCG motif-containing cysteine-rich protein [Petrachloros mirabilis]NCJ07768.1 CPXCG motif-containing cysteine-rich protein [Petrachloros mirabilis ULC683]